MLLEESRKETGRSVTGYIFLKMLRIRKKNKVNEMEVTYAAV